MRKLLISTAVAPCVFAGVCEEVYIPEHVPVPPYKVESKREIFGLCELILNINGQLVPVYATKDFVISGEMFSRKRQITQIQLGIVKNKVIRENLLVLDTLGYVSYKPSSAKGDKYLYFISDPDCPFCNRIKGKVKELADKYGYEIRLIWYPLPLHKSAKPKAISFLCENKTYEDYLRDDYGSKQCEEGKRDIEKNIRVLKEFVRGTPVFIFYNGKVVAGANVSKLEEAMR